MQLQINRSILEIIEGDITQQDTQAIVNAANEQLRVGGGVDGAINRAGGPAIQQEARQIGSCPTGQAVITTGGNLKAKYVIHTVGPRYANGVSGEPALLASCYRESLKLASSRGIKSLSFPSISTGIFGYPLAAAASIAVATVHSYLQDHPEIELVRFVLFGREAWEVYAGALQERAQLTRAGG